MSKKEFERQEKIARVFDPGDHVLVTLPGTLDMGRVVTIVKARGPGIIDILGFGLPCKQLYQVRVKFEDGSEADTEMNGNPILYPAEFLEYAYPSVISFAKQETIPMEAFFYSMEALGCKNIANTIYGIDGEK